MQQGIVENRIGAAGGSFQRRLLKSQIRNRFSEVDVLLAGKRSFYKLDGSFESRFRGGQSVIQRADLSSGVSDLCNGFIEIPDAGMYPRPIIRFQGRQQILHRGEDIRRRTGKHLTPGKCHLDRLVLTDGDRLRFVIADIRHRVACSEHEWIHIGFRAGENALAIDFSIR